MISLIAILLVADKDGCVIVVKMLITGNMPMARKNLSVVSKKAFGVLALAGFVLGFSLLPTQATQAQNQSSLPLQSQSQVRVSKPSLFSYSFSQQFSGDTITREAVDKFSMTDSGGDNPLYDRDAVFFDSTTALGASYQLSETSSLAVIQRIGYSKSVRSDRQTQAGLLALRLHYSNAVQFAGGEGDLTLRIAPAHTHYLYHDMNMLGAVALIPSLSWTIGPKLAVNYSGYFGGQFYNGPQRDTAE